MKRNMFGAWLIIVGLLFAAVTVGGCGGSSSRVQIPDSGGTDGSDLSMYEIWNDGEAMDEVFNRLTSEDTIKLLGLKMEVVAKDDGGQVLTQYMNMFRYIISNEEYPMLPYNKEELAAHYESEDIILISDADLEY